MQVHVEWIAGEVVVEHHFAADEGFEWESGEHVKSETEARDVDHCVVGGEVVEYVTLGEVAEGQEAREGH